MPRRQTTWFDRNLGLTITSGGQANHRLAGSLVPGDTEWRGRTVTRIIISPLTFHSTTVAGAWGTQSIVCGIGIVSLESFIASVVPDPFTEGEAPASGWLWKSELVASQNGISTPITISVDVDVHSQRRLQQGVLTLIVQNNPLFGTAFSVRMDGMSRTLLKLP